MNSGLCVSPRESGASPQQSESGALARPRWLNIVAHGGFPFASTRSAIATIKSQHQEIDVLVNNAGVMALADQATADGYDVQMQRCRDVA